MTICPRFSPYILDSFGGTNRKEQNNVFIKLNHNLMGAGCAGHIFLNNVRTAVDILPIEVELIVSKKKGM